MNDTYFWWSNVNLRCTCTRAIDSGVTTSINTDKCVYTTYKDWCAVTSAEMCVVTNVFTQLENLKSYVLDICNASTGN